MVELKRFRYYQVMTSDGWDVGFWDGNSWFFIDLNAPPSQVDVLTVIDEVKRPKPGKDEGA